LVDPLLVLLFSLVLDLVNLVQLFEHLFNATFVTWSLQSSNMINCVLSKCRPKLTESLKVNLEAGSSCNIGKLRVKMSHKVIVFVHAHFEVFNVVIYYGSDWDCDSFNRLVLSAETLKYLLFEHDGTIRIFAVPHCLRRGNDVKRNFVALVSHHNIRSVWVVLNVEVHLLFLLIEQVLDHSFRMINARHGETSCDSIEYILFERVVVST